MMDITPVMLGAIGLTGGALWQISAEYRANAPALRELRSADRDSLAHRQALMDTDILTGTLALGAGALAWILTGSPWPLLIVASTFLLVSCYHHLVLRGRSPADVETGV